MNERTPEDKVFIDEMEKEGVKKLSDEQYIKIIKALNAQLNKNWRDANKKKKNRAKRKAAKKHQRINRNK